MSDILEIQKTELLHEVVPQVVLLEPTSEDQILESTVDQVLVELGPADVLLESPQEVVLLEVAKQGPPGPRGLRGEPGPIGDAGGAFLISERLGEIAGDAAAQQAAQTNLGLGLVDPLAYYILAKA